jgi:hypothetical protein
MTGLLAVNFMRVAEILIFMQMHAYNRSYIKPLLAGTAAVSVVVLLGRFVVPGAGLARLVALASFLIIIYFLAIMVLGLDEHDKDLLKRLKSSVGRLRAADMVRMS